ncbi:MAG: hypothetical protein B7733_02330 [Myxococcales bacterium FL481]|nr:MAG: hypothetical protein B7733_02330 [Myxococcales bacterium FL481]
MKQLFITLALAAGVAAPLTYPALSQAGLKGSYPVTVSANSFRGSLGSARNSADAVQYIGCRDHGNVAWCYGRNAAGTVASCSTANAQHLAVVRGLTESSYLSVDFSAGTCTSMFQSNFSQLEPKQP